MNQDVYLSKSDFLKYQLCPSYLWLWKYKKDVVPVDESEYIKRRKEQGDEVEKCARQLFPEAVLVETKGTQAKQDTERLVADGTKTIFQATVFTDTGLFAMADGIDYDEDSATWTLLEIKSTNSVHKEHIHDVAFQKVAFEEAGYKIGRTGVIFLNKEYRRKSKVLAADFLAREDITDRVEAILPTIREQAYDALKSITNMTEPKGCSCRLKSRSNHCPTFQLLNPDIPAYSVFDITRIRGKKLEALVDSDIFDVSNVPDDMKLSAPQKNQVDAAKSGNTTIDKAAIARTLNELTFPLYFLDYETVSTAVPLYADCKPYQQIPFQYSLHVLRSPGNELEHYEYLSEDATTLPARELLETMERLLDDDGSVIVWHKSFEMGRNREMGETYPEYAAFMKSVNDRVFDLKEIFSKQYFIHPDFKGSNSIKDVLPVLVPELSYKELGIQNGQIAPIRWYDAVTRAVGETEARKIFDDLIKYCCLDTLAMVKIYEYLIKL
jgi:hypothetical protein